MPLPRFDNVAMDGYAIRTADVAAANPDGKVLVSGPVDRGQHVRRRGEDVASGSELLHAG